MRTWWAGAHICSVLGKTEFLVVQHLPLHRVEQSHLFHLSWLSKVTALSVNNSTASQISLTVIFQVQLWEVLNTPTSPKSYIQMEIKFVLYQFVSVVWYSLGAY